MTWFEAVLIVIVIMVLAIWKHGGEEDKTR